jgi:hypothetical protein
MIGRLVDVVLKTVILNFKMSQNGNQQGDKVPV